MNIQRDAAPPPKFLHTDSRHPVCIFGRAQTSHHADTAFCGGLFLDQAAKHLVRHFPIAAARLTFRLVAFQLRGSKRL